MVVHGLVNRGLQSFVVNIYGTDTWEEVCLDAQLPFQNFETMLPYDDLLSEQVLDSISKIVSRHRTEILEDFGTFLVSEHCSPAVRRLLRLGGQNFSEFLLSLEDVYDRVSIAVSDLDMPLMKVEMKSACEYVVQYEFNKCGYGTVFLGLLRAMADDYGCLVTIDHQSRTKFEIDYDIFRVHIFKRSSNTKQSRAA